MLSIGQIVAAGYQQVAQADLANLARCAGCETKPSGPLPEPPTIGQRPR